MLAAGITQTSAIEGKLVLYTSQPNTDAQQTMDAFTAKHPGVTVEWVRNGTPKIPAKLQGALELPYAVPGIVLAIACILLFLRPLPLIGSLYATAWIILAAYLMPFAAFAAKLVAAALR